jgi:hypothetical protein
MSEEYLDVESKINLVIELESALSADVYTT